MNKVNFSIPPELIAMSQRNPFREFNDNQGQLEGTQEVVTVVLIVVKVAAAAAVAGGPSCLKDSISL